ncbi:hypothetical protein BSKO_10776 [Bryopsis sp. KO-2023]|nr:hypothetical protein BSKO_10776 [Bryopsis sp. KO-2023]
MGKVIVIDARGHLLGRLAAVVAKQLLWGYEIVVVRCEGICISGGLVRQRMKFERFLRKRMNTKPSHGPIHYRAPSRIFWRTVRGMVPHKTARGTAAMGRLTCVEGIPAPYDKKKRVVVPKALKVTRLGFNSRSCLLEDLSESVGWKYKSNINELETKRKADAKAHYAKVKAEKKLFAKAAKEVAEA